MVRWRFTESSAADESAERETTSALIDEWWKVFVSKTEDLSALFEGRSKWDLPAWIQRHLQAIDDRLMWEFGPARGIDGHRLVITPEADRQLRPLVGEILRRAPKIDGWEFYAYRLQEPAEVAKPVVQARCGNSIDGWKVHAASGDGNLVDLTFLVPGLRPKQADAAKSTAFIASETLLGEETLDKWIGAIEVAPTKASRGLLGRRSGQPPIPPDSDPVADLRDRVDIERERIRDALAQQPHHVWAEDSEWALIKLTPSEARDFADQDDLFVARTPNLRLWEATRRSLFFDERFSRCGETFCYLKLDGAQGLDEELFAGKAEMEDAIDAVLKPDGLGCQIGGGTGRRYSYIELALTDLDRGVRAVRDRLRAGNVPRRSWLLFHNADLRGEWIGIYDDSPAPILRV